MGTDNTSVWTFEQLGGQRKKLELSDHCAPHGRPRVKPVVETELEQRNDKAYYAGNSTPTRHLFGPMEQPQKIAGRLRDANGGQGFARAKRNEIRSFVGDGQQCLVTWDDIISQLCLIESVKFGIESGGEITYELTILVDKDQLSDEPSTPVIRAIGPQNLTNQLLLELANMNDLTEVPGLKGSIFDSVSALISSVAAATSAVNQVANQIDSFVNAPFQLMNQLRDALHQLRSAIVTLRQAYDDLTVNIALENENAKNEQAFWDVQAAWAVSSLAAIQLALQMDRAAVVAQQGSILAIYTAKDGDTWDQISRVVYSGSADRAADIRNANGVDAGSNPIPGTNYLVPV